MQRKKGRPKAALAEPPHLASLLIPYTVGFGFTKREQYKLSVEKFGFDAKPSHITNEEWLDTCLKAWKAITPEETHYNNLETKAKQILEAAKLPAMDSVYSIPDGRPLPPDEWKTYTGRRGTLLALAEAQGYRERIDKEWYAAKILVDLFALRACIEKGKPRAAALIAFALGMLANEMVIQLDKVAAITRKGGSRRKSIPAVYSFVRSRLKVNPSLSAKAIWSKIPRDEFKGLRFGKQKLFIEQDCLLITEKQGKEWKKLRTLSYPAFRKYVTIVRKDLSR